MPNVPVIKLNNGRTIPQLGLGTWKSKPGEVTEAVKQAIDLGYRHIDCAFVYGNEKEVGAALKEKLASGVVKREELFITSKLWNTFHRADLVPGALQTSLDNLGLEYLDLYLIHWPQAYKEDGELFPTDKTGKIEFSDTDYIDTWRALEAEVAAGRVRGIGVSNFNRRQLQRLLDHAKIKPVVNQVECHPYLNQSKLKQFCESKGIVLTAYSPLGSPDRPWAKPDEPRLLDDPKLVAIATRLGKTVAQVLIRWQLDRGNVVIPKSVSAARIAANLNVLDFSLTPEDVRLVDSFHCDGRFVPMTASLGHKDHPFENDEY